MFSSERLIIVLTLPQQVIIYGRDVGNDLGSTLHIIGMYLKHRAREVLQARIKRVDRVAAARPAVGDDLHGQDIGMPDEDIRGPSQQ